MLYYLYANFSTNDKYNIMKKSKVNDFLYALARSPDFKAAWTDTRPELEITRFLTEARREKGLTQEQLAELSGVSKSEIELLENGKGDPSLQTLKRLATALGKNLQLFFI